MQIPVRCACGACREWALIEFQVRQPVESVPSFVPHPPPPPPAAPRARTPVSPLLSSLRGSRCAPQGEIEVQEPGLSLNDLEVGTLCQVAKVSPSCRGGRRSLSARALSAVSYEPVG